MITLSQARTYLSRYAGHSNDFTERLNLVTERLMKAGDWRSTKDTVLFQVHIDDQNRAFITLPAKYNTVLGAVLLHTRNTGTDLLRRCGYPMQMRDEWFSYLPEGVGFTDGGKNFWGQGFVPEVDRFTTFKNFYAAVYLRFKFAATEANGGIINVRGKHLGQPVYTGTGSNTVEGENLTIAGATTLTTTSLFDEIPYSVVKPVTYGAVSMYTWDGTTETLVARYDPQETVPQWRRYRIPACTQWTEAEPGQYLTVCKREWMTISNDNDPVVPGNIGALRFGLQALLKEDAEDYQRAEEMWQKAEQLLANESQDDTGAGADTPVRMADSWGLGAGLGSGFGWDGNGYGGYYFQ